MARITQRGRAAEAVHAGHLFALWITDGLDPVRIEAGMVSKLGGAKVFCSAAGHATQAVITARRGDKILLLHVALRDARPTPGSAMVPLGMRAAATGGMAFDGVLVSEYDIIGKPGDYLREPEFSAGAWRACAGLLGGLDALTGEVKAQLIARKRDGHPHQLARLGQIVIAQETASLWVNRAASVVEDPSMAAGDRQSSRLLHGAALLCVTLAVILLITPAALHRVVWAGEDSEELLHRGDG
jgi:alkylation response protein AidB-like acyl-CoA dehydrogenase